MSQTKIVYKYRVGLSLGNVIAALLSWTANKSIIWALIHGILGWFYIIYYLFQYGCTGNPAP